MRPFMRTISAMRTLLIAAVATSSVLLSACARSPQRLDLVALNGQPVSQAVVDQRECEAEFPFTREESTLQAYASCLLARGYVSEVPLSASSGTKRITLYVRPERPGRSPSEIRNDITACQGEVQKAYSDVSLGYKFSRFMTSYYTGGGPYGGGVNIQRGELIKTFGA